MQLLSYLTESANTLIKKNQKSANIYINKAISYIHKNYQNPITVQEIARLSFFKPELSDRVICQNSSFFSATIFNEIPHYKSNRIFSRYGTIHRKYCLFVRIL